MFFLQRKHYFDKKNAERQEGNEIDMDKYMVLDQVGSGEEGYKFLIFISQDIFFILFFIVK